MGSKELDEVTSTVLKLLFYVYLAVSVGVAFIFAILVVGVLLARYIVVRCILRSESYVKQSSFQNALGSMVR